MSPRSLLLRLAVLCLFTLPLAGAADAAVCSDQTKGCQVNVATSIGNPQFPPLCIDPYHVIQINVQVVCNNCEFVNPPIYVCGATSLPITVSACNKTFTLEPNEGRRWEDALSDCTSFTIK